ncbi:MAG TPA: site-2 protease family protein, partial [Candidatus Saccharimonas sp.]|nr:site-2 protease family protein [Candidatus Saccharimonas sp.]
MPSDSKPTPKKRGWLTWITVAGKSSKLVSVFKSAKLLKPLLTIGSMGLSVFAYAFVYSWVFSVGFVLMIFVHEMGHVWMLRRKGFKASAPVFIPFLGAAVFAPRLGDRDEEAQVGMAGPLIGSLGAVALLLPAAIIPNPPILLVLIASTALFINLFNLIPLLPLDGGRVTQAIGPAFKYVGVAALLIVTLLLRNPGILIIWIVVLSDVRAKPKLIAATGVALEAIMVFMMQAGIGEAQPWWVNLIDIILATFLNALMLFRAFSKDTKLWADPDTRPQLPPRLKRRWLLIYTSMVVVMLVLVIY